MAKLGIEFDGFEKLIQKLEDVEGASEQAVENALVATHELVTGNLQSAIAPHRRTGETEKSLKRNAEVTWVGTTAEVEVGFDIDNGGLPSVFLMNGTRVNGTPRVKPDTKLQNAIYGAKTKKEIAELQEKEFRKCITG